MSYANLAPNTLLALPGASGSWVDPGTVVVNGLVLTVKWAEINASAGGNTQVVAAVAGAKLRVLSLDFVCAGAVTVGWQSAANVKRNNQSFAANSGMARDLAMPYYVETNAGEALNINLGGAVVVRGAVGYVEVLN